MEILALLEKVFGIKSIWNFIINLENNEMRILLFIILLGIASFSMWTCILTILLILVYEGIKMYSRRKRRQLFNCYLDYRSKYLPIADDLKRFDEIEKKESPYSPSYNDGKQQLKIVKEEIKEELKLLEEKSIKIILTEHLHEFTEPYYIRGNHDKDSFIYYLAVTEHKIRFFDNQLNKMGMLIKNPIYSN